MIQHVKKISLQGTVAIPSSKSDGQRALLCAGLSQGSSRIQNLGESDDEKAMLQNIQRIGAEVTKLNNHDFQIIGADEIAENLHVNCGESGLGLRLLTSVLSTFEGDKSLNGHGSILKREHRFFSEFLPSMGVDFLSNDHKLPFSLKGMLKAGNYVVDGAQSSQFISGLLIAFARLEEDVFLTVENLKSRPYVDMTLATMSAFGVEITAENDTFKISGDQCFKSTSYFVESDWSSASYWLAAGAIGHAVQLKNLNPNSLQADKAMLKALENAQCVIHETEDGILSVDGKELSAFEFDATHCPDLFPALVTVAAYCKGKSKIRGLKRLKNKESDRGEVLKQEFEKLGLQIDLREDEMVIHGTGSLCSGNVDAHNDHRIAMCLGIAGTRIEGGVEISGAESVSKSYPGFWNDFKRLSGH